MTQTGIPSLREAVTTQIEFITAGFNGPWLYCGGPAGPGVGLAAGDSRVRRYETAVTPARHDFTEIFICSRGQCAMAMGDRVYPLTGGDAAVILPGTVHSEMSPVSGSYIGVWVIIGEGRAMMHLSGKNDLGGFHTVEGRRLSDTGRCAALAVAIGREAAGDRRHWEVLVKSCLLEILIGADREFHNAAPSGPDWKQSVIDAVRDYIEDHYTRAVALEDIAREVHMSENYLNTLYKSATGSTIIQSLGDRRIREACRLLAGTREPLAAIAARLGYYDQFHFSRAFKKAAGVSPSAYRKGK